MIVALMIVVTLLLISVVVGLHELGHYFAARWYGVNAQSFSIGFGPELFGRTDSRGTRWKFSAIPLGGYVQLESTDDATIGMVGKVPWRGFALINVAGCLVNFLTGWLYLALLGQPWLIFLLLKDIVTGFGPGIHSTIFDPGSDLAFAGPIGIVDVLSTHPVVVLIVFPIVSISLAVINLVPIPALDGGHLVIGTIEHIRGRPISEKTSAILTATSAAVVVGFMFLVTWSDVVHVF